MASIKQDNRIISRAAALLLFGALALLGFLGPHLIATEASPALESLQKRTPQSKRSQTTRRRGTNSSAQPPPVNYSSFNHSTVAHQKSCDSCHKFPSANWKEVRKGDDAFPDVTEYPQHASCLGCHQQQFFRGAQPVICSVCHVNITPRNTVRYPFPSLGEPFYASKRGQTFASDFRINFPHAKHMDLVGQAWPGFTGADSAREERASHGRRLSAQDETDKKCAMCHQTYQPQGKSAEEYVTKPPKDLGDKFWLKKGTFKTILLTHATCFTCHSQDSGISPAPTDCNTCHKLASTQPAQPAPDFDAKLAATMGVADPLILMKWRRRDSAGAFRHEGGAHPDLSCSVCHKTDTMNTLDPKTQKVSISACADCHVTATSGDGGALNLEIDQRKANASFQCSKCHVIFGRLPVPVSHTSLIPAAKSK